MFLLIIAKTNIRIEDHTKQIALQTSVSYTPAGIARAYEHALTQTQTNTHTPKDSTVPHTLRDIIAMATKLLINHNLFSPLAAR